MTKIYLIRHAESDRKIQTESKRPLTEKGRNDAENLVEIFKHKKINKIYSSPFIRTIETIKPILKKKNLTLQKKRNFRERKIGTYHSDINDFLEFVKKQWNDFSYKLPFGESLNDVQRRNIKELNKIVRNNPNSEIIIGTHGTAMCSILHYFDNTIYNYDYFMKIGTVMPFIVSLEIEAENVIISEITKT